jgi:membrane-bound serine protease (ClpP class)
MPLIVAIAAASACIFLFAVVMMMRSRERAVVSGPEEMIGLDGEVVSWSGHVGRVRTHGEIWQARASDVLAPGSRVRIAGRDGLVLEVRPEKKET